MTQKSRGIARIEQSGDRVRQLEEEIDRLTARLRDLERDNDRMPPPYLATRYYDESALASLVMNIALINFWNRVNITTRQVAGSVPS